ncbi:hypothetical protein DIPPA_11739 [Diplonema papillatum]|nr:hypothetical protein DIPPA_11739 [Diplonema papillatum]
MSASLRQAHKRYTADVTVIGLVCSGSWLSSFGTIDTSAVVMLAGQSPVASTRFMTSASAFSRGSGNSRSSAMRQPSTPDALFFGFFLSRIRSSSPVIVPASIICGPM